MIRALLNEIKEDEKLYEYIKNNSVWFVYLQRNPNNINELIKTYKKYKNEKRINDVDTFIDNVDLISTIINMK